jgi:ceramide glucosyltransferase
MQGLAILAALVASAGLGLIGCGAALVGRFRAAPAPGASVLPAITVLRPLHGDEPLLEAALASACAQDYPRFQVVFGVQDPADPALAVAERVRARFPACDIAVVVDDTAPGRNRKVANLTNMLGAARHPVLVIADSDVHAAPDYLRQIAAALDRPGIGLVTTLYAGRPGSRTLAARLGASAITHGFLPGALISRALGRQDALGATMALRRATLDAIGGFAALRDHLADDNLLGRRVRALGLDIGLAATVPGTTVPEARLVDLYRHELRWGRTIRALAPLSFAGSGVQYPLVWALLAVAASGGAAWALALFAACWVVRATAAGRIDRALGLPVAPPWHWPLRDLMSVVVLVASFLGDGVDWRGVRMRAEPAPRAPAGLGIEQA